MGRNISDLLGKSLDGSRLELLHLLAYQASMLRMPLFLVGGVVRDVLLGRAVKDFDLVVEGDGTALAELVLKKYGGRVMIHSWFGTATWAVNESTFKRLEVPLFDLPEADMSFDLITARSETYAQPGALPTVKFSNIDDDLRRRDFTINAMAVRLDGGFFGDLSDPLHGQKDLEDGLIRVLHERSFVDDPTRMLRAARYAERYGFEIERGTLKLVNDEARGILSQLSGERVRHEFDLVFDEERALVILDKLKGLDLLRAVHPALQNADCERLSGLVDAPPDGFGKVTVPDILSFRQALGWVLYLMNLSLIDLEEIEVRLSFPALLARAVREASSLLVDIPSFQKWKPSQWTFRLDDVHPLAMCAVWLATSESALQEYLTHWRTVRPVTTGDDLKARGLEPGPKFKEILTRLRAAWLDGEVGTEEEEKKLLDSIS